MTSAPQVQTAEISDAELDGVSGGLNPQAGVVAGPAALDSTDLMAQLGTVTDTVQGAAGQLQGAAAQFNRVGVYASL
ncbi:hypothetical protein [Streptomyces cellostaticus]|uniref:hypothetical protein n=1 Tax=Streptomyces TaxID=1883 RepID=UPI0020270054|nr:hypothetical protein [Streptomyces cellostaticus]